MATRAVDESLAGVGVMMNDYVVVDDVGDFSYYPSETAMLDDLEYVDEAACIVDRAGHDYRLTMDSDRRLRLGPSLGTVEFNWLRQAWTNNQQRNMQSHPLQRFYPTTLEALLTGLFEMLYLEHAGRTSGAPWILEADGEVTHPATLQEVNRLLARADHLERVTVHDPFGHDYQPIRHAGHRFFLPTAGSVYYIEVPGRVKRTAVHH